jgi:DUF1365 family protein
MNSAFYAGIVTHARLRPKRHRFSYRVFSLLIDLDELAALDRLKLFGHNRRAAFSFLDRDHGAGDGDVRGWVAVQLAAAGISLEHPAIRLLCYPRIFGYVFNPLTVYFCSDGDMLRAILYEVHNTFGEKRTYVIGVTPGDQGGIEQACRKELYVSPFVPMDCAYRFDIEPPGERVLIGISETDRDGLLLRASFTGERRELTDATLRRALFAYPLMTLKVTAAIHWEALRLWAKGVPYLMRKPAASRIATTIVD